MIKIEKNADFAKRGERESGLGFVQFDFLQGDLFLSLFVNASVHNPIDTFRDGIQALVAFVHITRAVTLWNPAIECKLLGEGWRRTLAPRASFLGHLRSFRFSTLRRFLFCSLLISLCSCWLF